MVLEPPDDIQDWTDEEKYPQISEEYLLCVVCGQPDCFCESEPCQDCFDGQTTNCPDDLCQGESGCIHGDNYGCPTCDGEGDVYPDKVTEKEYLKLKSKEVKPNSSQQ